MSKKVKCRDCNGLCKSNQKALQCNACEEWLHITCSNVSEPRYTLMMQLKAMIGENEEDDNPWFCKFCNKKVTEMSKVIGIIDKKL